MAPVDCEQPVVVDCFYLSLDYEHEVVNWAQVVVGEYLFDEFDAVVAAGEHHGFDCSFAKFDCGGVGGAEGFEGVWERVGFEGGESDGIGDGACEFVVEGSVEGDGGEGADTWGEMFLDLQVKGLLAGELFD